MDIDDTKKITRIHASRSAFTHPPRSLTMRTGCPQMAIYEKLRLPAHGVVIG